jgi:hypothetical protein
MASKFRSEDRQEAEAIMEGFALALEKMGAKVERNTLRGAFSVRTLRDMGNLEHTASWVVTCAWSDQGRGTVFPATVSSVKGSPQVCANKEELEAAILDLAGSEDVAKAIVWGRTRGGPPILRERSRMRIVLRGERSSP